MAMCASGLLVSALVLIIILNDIVSYKINYLFEHSMLGAIVCTLFFTLCNYGLEQVNWIFLALIPISIFIKSISIQGFTTNNECEVCEESMDTCDCSCITIQKDQVEARAQVKAQVQAQTNAETKAKVMAKKQAPASPALNCPAKPLTLATKCGISRYYE